MYLPIRTLRTSGIPKCRIASRTAFPCGSSTAAFGITMTFAFITAQYLQPTGKQEQSPKRSLHLAHLLQNDNVEQAVSAENIHPYVAFVVSGKQKINACVSYFQITNAHLRKKRGQKGFRKHESVFWSQHTEAERGLQQKKHGTRGPRLRGAGNWIQRGRFTGAPGKTAK